MTHEIKKVVIECENTSQITDVSYTFWYQENPDKPSRKESHQGATRRALELFEDWVQFSIRLFNDVERNGDPRREDSDDIEKAPSPTTIAEWVKFALSVHAIETWPLVTGVNPHALQRWMNGEELPSSRDLWDLLAVTSRYHTRFAQDFDRLADRPFAEVIGRLPLPEGFRTLKEYAHSWRLEELKDFILCLPFRRGHDLAEIFVAATTREILRKDRE